MRVSIVSILLAGGMIALGACSTSVDPGDLTVAERAEICRGVRGEITATGRQTGDVRQDYRCRSRHARAEANVTSDGAARSTAIDRGLQGRIN